MVAFLLICLCFIVMRLVWVREHIDRILLRAPYLNRCIRDYCLSSLFRTLHVLLKSGARLDVALSLVADGMRNTAYRDSLAAMKKHVLTGVPCTTYMRTVPGLFPVATVQLLAAGERTGTLAESALTIAEISEDSLRREMQVLSTLAEPFLMVAMGLIVGFVAMAIISPMYALTQGLSLQ
jgi:type II secretory pathway component PulF